MVTRKLGSRSIDEEEWERISRLSRKSHGEGSVCSRHEVARNTLRQSRRSMTNGLCCRKVIAN